MRSTAKTLPEIRQYRNDGVLTLCMESAAVWAVCQHRDAVTASVHETGDYLDPNDWVPESENNRVELLDPTVTTLTEYVVVE